MKPLRSIVKLAVECVLGSRGSLAVARLRLQGSRLVVAYHNVTPAGVPTSRGDTSLHLPLDRFRAQLDALAGAGFEVVPATAALDPSSSAPQVVITFDDAYAGALDLAIPELASRCLPATIFVAPGLLGAEAPWWDQLADPVLGAVSDGVRVVALGELQGDGERILANARARAWTLQAPAREHRVASERQLRLALTLHPGLTLGAHGWSHANLSSVGAEQLEREIRATLSWLRDRFGERAVPWLAYPYGLDSEEARAAALRAGYSGAFLVTGGWQRGNSDQFALPRLNITPGLSLPGFRARLAGLV